jgi:O-acetyl-ADP-ribose deacetylase (regulator of RNase III)
MPVEYVAGDLFKNRHRAEALAHGCNCAGSMGAGIAIGFRERYPAMFEEYRRRCKADPPEFALGGVFFWREDGKPAVFNLGTQPRPGRGATYPAVEAALRAMHATADAEGVKSVALPRIAAGYGGLSWKKVRALIDAAFADWAGTVYVYEEFRPEQQRPTAGTPGRAKKVKRTKKRTA